MAYLNSKSSSSEVLEKCCNFLTNLGDLVSVSSVHALAVAKEQVKGTFKYFYNKTKYIKKVFSAVSEYLTTEDQDNITYKLYGFWNSARKPTWAIKFLFVIRSFEGGRVTKYYKRRY